MSKKGVAEFMVAVHEKQLCGLKLTDPGVLQTEIVPLLKELGEYPRGIRTILEIRGKEGPILNEHSVYFIFGKIKKHLEQENEQQVERLKTDAKQDLTQALAKHSKDQQCQTHKDVLQEAIKHTLWQPNTPWGETLDKQIDAMLKDVSKEGAIKKALQQHHKAFGTALHEQALDYTVKSAFGNSLFFIGYLNQVSIQADMAIASKEMIYKSHVSEFFRIFGSFKEYNAMFQLEPQESSAESRQAKVKGLRALMQKLSEEKWEGFCNFIGEEMKKVHSLQTIIHYEGDECCTCLYVVPLMKKETFICVAQSLDIWGEGIDFQTTLAIAQDFFNGKLVGIEEMCMKEAALQLKDPSANWEFYRDRFFKRLTEAQEEVCRAREQLNESPKAILHNEFAQLTTTILHHLATHSYPIICNLAFVTSNLYDSLGEDKVAASCKLEKSFKRFSAKKKGEFDASKSKLAELWQKISCLALEIPKEQEQYTATGEKLFVQLTEEVETDFGLHQMMAKMLGEVPVPVVYDACD